MERWNEDQEANDHRSHLDRSLRREGRSFQQALILPSFQAVAGTPTATAFFA
jgi:hypothetical protein